MTNQLKDLSSEFSWLEKSKTVFLSLSGGVDSTTVYYFLNHQGLKVVPVAFQYPSKHNHMELAAAERVAKRVGSELRIVDTTSLFAHTSSHLLLSGGKIPDEDYTRENLKKTVVPGRNTIFISVLASMAESVARSEEGKRSYIALGVHAGDNDIYPDCRPSYVDSVRDTICLSTEETVFTLAPLLKLTKGQVVKLGLELKVPFEITRSCYNGQDKPCRTCPTCRAREQAFIEAGTTDPLL